MVISSYATHQVPLMTAILSSSGPVLELGCGWYSTPLVHTLCCHQDRRAVSLETNEEWHKQFIQYNCNGHSVVVLAGYPFKNGKFLCRDSVDNYRRLHRRHMEEIHKDADGPMWGVVLVDQAPGFLRNTAIEFFSDLAEFVVVHDTTPEGITHYGYEPFLSKYKHRAHYSAQSPHTTVVSNFKKIEFF